MIEIRKTEIFAKWIDSLQDIHGRARAYTGKNRETDYGQFWRC